MSRHGYRGDGAYGQFCVVLPEHDAVVVTTAATEDMQAILDAMWEHLLPALRPAGAGSRTDPADEATLVRRLAGLQRRCPRSIRSRGPRTTGPAPPSRLPRRLRPPSRR